MLLHPQHRPQRLVCCGLFSSGHRPPAACGPSSLIVQGHLPCPVPHHVLMPGCMFQGCPRVASDPRSYGSSMDMRGTKTWSRCVTDTKRVSRGDPCSSSVRVSRSGRPGCALSESATQRASHVISDPSQGSGVMSWGGVAGLGAPGIQV